MSLTRPWHTYVGLEAGTAELDGPNTVVWLDIDNTLYPQAESNIAGLMMDRIRAYFMRLGMSDEEAEELHTHYYREYGLAIRGLVKHHTIDPLDYDAQCDASLPLEDILRPCPKLVALLESLDRSKCRVYALTNAYKTHATRVLKLVGLSHVVDAIVYCDYSNPDFSCKPEAEFFLAAAEAVNAQDATHYFVDDSLQNVKAAHDLGWHSVHFDEGCEGLHYMSLPTRMPEAERPFLDYERTRRRRTYRISLFKVLILLVCLSLGSVFVGTLRANNALTGSFGQRKQFARPTLEEYKVTTGQQIAETTNKVAVAGAAPTGVPHTADLDKAGKPMTPIDPSEIVPSRKNSATKFEHEHIDFDSIEKLNSSAFPAELSDSISITLAKLYPRQDPHRGELSPQVLALLENPPKLTPPPEPKAAPVIPASNWTLHAWSAEKNGSRTSPADAERPDTQQGAFDWRPAPYNGWQPPLANLTRESKTLPRIQHAFQNGSRFSGRNDDEAREKLIAERRRLVKNAFIRAWQGYKMYAWGADELRPVSRKPKNNFNGWGATIVDTLDTLLVMDLQEEYNYARNHIHDIDFHMIGGTRSAYGQADGRVPVFETAIRYLGGLLAAHDLTGDVLMKERAEELAQLIMPAFETLTGLPVGRIRFDDPTNYTVEEPRGRYERVTLAEATSMLLEFTRLWQVTGNRTYFDTVQRVTDFVDRNLTSMSAFGTLLPTGVYTRPLQLVGKYTFGGMVDSYYEYLIKEHQLLGGRLEQYPRMFGQAMDSAIQYLLRKIRVVANAPSLIVASMSSARPTSHMLKLEHLSCFTGAMFALSSRLLPSRTHDLEIARRYTESCFWMYNSTFTGLGAEDMLFYRPEDQDRFEIVEKKNGKLYRGSANGYPIKGVRSMNGIYQNRPEAIESIMYMWRVTGDEIWQERGWQMFASWMTHSLTEVGVSSIVDVMEVPARKGDGQESFALAETFKYYYLLFSPPDLISLDDFVFSTEAHPLLVPKEGKWREAGAHVPHIRPWTPPPAASGTYAGGENGVRGGMTNSQKHEYAKALRDGTAMATKVDMDFAYFRDRIQKMLNTIKE
ncbi:mannosyl-oligosaccharide 1,2-alpha-mannosidase [Malassezia cuniculi]|uniref:alpha-1,2-Mannosidase n=1 Tax=Malassezia cuniculi TaxID=948313 RepID=A0AAF0ETA2_9BASI|nr:mannosyl-oligosaccharide 1,2-alpha-mannosidase [Malassezia cuniculi]